MGWCSSTALAGLLFVAWDWLMKQLVFIPDDDDETASGRLPVRSMDQQHAFGVLLMGVLKFEDSSSIWESAMCFILDLLHCGRCRRTGLQQQRRSTTAKVVGYSNRGLFYNFLFVQGCLVKGLVVKVLY
jgi:hypothetical protein